MFLGFQIHNFVVVFVVVVFSVTLFCCLQMLSIWTSQIFCRLINTDSVEFKFSAIFKWLNQNGNFLTLSHSKSLQTTILKFDQNGRQFSRENKTWEKKISLVFRAISLFSTVFSQDLHTADT